MTAATATAPVVPAPMHVASEKQVRKSIKKYFPLGQIMSTGQANPITLHSVNEDVFPRLWSFMAEVMIVEGELQRSTKEAIGEMVSSKNQCPMCVTAHRMMGTAAKRAEKSSKKHQEEYERLKMLHNEAMDYAETLIDNTMNDRNSEEENENISTDFDICFESAPTEAVSTNYNVLTEAGKAEAALVVVLYNHMNRIISAILGEQMSTAMFSVPKSAAEKMESTSVMNVMNKIMSPFLAGGMKTKHKPGITAPLFPDGSSCLEFVPAHLKAAELAGEERLAALSRLVAWTELYETEILGGVISQQIIKILDDPTSSPPVGMRTHKIAHWATVTMRKVMKSLPDETSKAIANICLLVSYSPQSVFNSIHWKTVVKALGPDQAKTIVIWWSMRFTFKHSKGLRIPGVTEQPGW